MWLCYRSAQSLAVELLHKEEPVSKEPVSKEAVSKEQVAKEPVSKEPADPHLEEWFKHGGTLLGGMINPRDMRQHVNRVCIVFQCKSVGLSMFTKLSLRAQCSNPLFLHDVFFIKMTCPWFHVIYQKSVFCQILLHRSTSSCQLGLSSTRDARVLVNDTLINKWMTAAVGKLYLGQGSSCCDGPKFKRSSFPSAKKTQNFSGKFWPIL